ncbi:hypothetical protein L1987_06336 [Smallanthus sonchifolius]|uniref:Uncharacterized protein n=1 Tax=Smallanthus sonchifolius TaxID=185202 RepID=A0ACB9JXU8_9ASTR|nr:hypothetical protein L1987_06336 [Smallanthus sonchifolius]
MAHETITALKNLDAMKDDYTVKVRIIRLWTRPTFRNPLSVYCYDMILMDEEVSNGYTGSKLFINADIEEISIFKNRFIEASISESSTTQYGFTTSIFIGPEDEFLNKNQFSSIGEINVTKEVNTRITCTLKTDGSGDFDEATFLECESPKCLNSVISAVPRYKIHVRVQDCTGTVTLTLFDQVVAKFLQISANELLNNNEELSKDGVIIDEFNSLINKKWAFKFYVGEFNLANNKDGYTISKVTDDPSIISELEKKILSLAPVSNILKSKKDSPVEDQITPSSMFVGSELKRNLQCIYDVDEGSSQSSTKPRTCYKIDDDNAYKRVEEDGGCKGKLLIPKVEK